MSKPGRLPIDIRSIARSHAPEAIATLAGLMRESPNHFVRVACAQAILDRGYGKPKTDSEGGEQLTITIRKILETVTPQPSRANGKDLVIVEPPLDGEIISPGESDE